MAANDKQIAGSHYVKNAAELRHVCPGCGRVNTTYLQHWDIVKLFKLDYFQGQITKYVMRWKDKNGVEDLRKAGHFLEKYTENEQGPEVRVIVRSDTGEATCSYIDQ